MEKITCTRVKDRIQSVICNEISPSRGKRVRGLRTKDKVQD